MIFAGYIQKTVKADLHVRVNYAILPWNQRWKVLEDSKGHRTKAERQRVHVGLADHTYRLPSPWGHLLVPRCYVGFWPPPRLHLHRSLSRFDPRAYVASSGLYIPGPTPLRHQVVWEDRNPNHPQSSTIF
jgi:hypothetical protein